MSKVGQLMHWFSTNGGHLNRKAEMLHDVEYGYHYIAKSGTIQEREIICNCPFSLTLSHLNVLPKRPAAIRDCSIESVCSPLVDHAEIERKTTAIFFLAEQRLRGRDSFWYPYIQLLPTKTEMTTPLWFNDDDMAYLKGTNLLSNDIPHEQTSLGLQERCYREQWNSGIQILERAGVATKAFTWELFLWAATIFSSRGFTSNLFMVNGDENAAFPILYPVLDTFNHQLGAKVKWKLGSGDFSIYSKENIEQGLQIFNNYSPKGNEDLLMGFGFCIPDNPYDEVVLRLGQVQPEIHRRLHDSIPSHWKSETWQSGESIFRLRRLSCRNDEHHTLDGIPKLDCLRGIPPELAKSVYVIMLERAESALGEGKSVPNHYVWASTIDLLLQQMEATLIGIKRWDDDLPSSPKTTGAEAALIYRAGQVQILESVIYDLKEFMNPIRGGQVCVEDALKNTNFK